MSNEFLQTPPGFWSGMHRVMYGGKSESGGGVFLNAPNGYALALQRQRAAERQDRASVTTALLASDPEGKTGWAVALRRRLTQRR